MYPLVRTYEGKPFIIHVCGLLSSAGTNVLHWQNAAMLFSFLWLSKETQGEDLFLAVQTKANCMTAFWMTRNQVTWKLCGQAPFWDCGSFNSWTMLPCVVRSQKTALYLAVAPECHLLARWLHICRLSYWAKWCRNNLQAGNYEFPWMPEQWAKPQQRKWFSSLDVVLSWKQWFFPNQ